MGTKRDIFDEMFDHPELTLKQADRKLRIERWKQRMPAILIVTGVIVALVLFWLRFRV